jgi:tetratricopeptide (TPR) repeat protein
MVQRDYIERLIQQVVQALSLMLGLRERGEHERALRSLEQTESLVLGPDHALLRRMEARSMVSLLGRHDVERVRLYAVLVAEEGVTLEAMGDGERSRQRYRRALDLYHAAEDSGAKLDDADHDRIHEMETALHQT